MIIRFSEFDLWGLRMTFDLYQKKQGSTTPYMLSMVSLKVTLLEILCWQAIHKNIGRPIQGIGIGWINHSSFKNYPGGTYFLNIYNIAAKTSPKATGNAIRKLSCLISPIGQIMPKCEHRIRLRLGLHGLTTTSSQNCAADVFLLKHLLDFSKNISKTMSS